jgi:hypothetical protein
LSSGTRAARASSRPRSASRSAACSGKPRCTNATERNFHGNQVPSGASHDAPPARHDPLQGLRGRGYLVARFALASSRRRNARASSIFARTTRSFIRRYRARATQGLHGSESEPPWASARPGRTAWPRRPRVDRLPATAPQSRIWEIVVAASTPRFSRCRHHAGHEGHWAGLARDRGAARWQTGSRKCLRERVAASG